MNAQEFTQKGNELLRSGRWLEARVAFEKSLTLEESPEALEGLGTSCSWLNDGDGAVRAREKAFRLYEQARDHRSAGRVATWLANEYGEFRGEGAVAAGWLTRAQRLLEPLEPCEEQAATLIMLASVKLFVEKDLPAVRALAGKARSIAEDVKSVDCMAVAGALEGLARVSEGEVKEGMAILDEATATAVGGECSNLHFIGQACCCLIVACEKVRDYDRAAQWCHYVQEFSRRWRIGSLFAVCRTQYASVLISRGAWKDAEEELLSAIEEFSERRPALIGGPTVRMGELRRRQGRFSEALDLFTRTESYPLSHLGRSALTIDQGDFTGAISFAERFLRKVPREDQVDRVRGLELLVRGFVGKGEVVKADEVLARIQSIAESGSTPPLQAGCLFAEGLVATLRGDHPRAVGLFEDAVDLFERSRLPFEAIESRIELAQVLTSIGDRSRGAREADLALARAQELGAAFLARRAATLTTHAVEATGTQGRDDTTLSAREREVLLLVAEGKDNNQIADELFLSVRTVERHLSNTYRKLGISGKSARSAATAYAIRTLQSGQR